MAEHKGKEDKGQPSREDKHIKEIRSEMEKIGFRLERTESKDEDREELREDLREYREELRNDLRGFKDELRRGQWGILVVAGAIVLFFVGKTYLDARNFLGRQVGKVNVMISERLDSEFGTERIQELIASKAEEYAEKESQKYIEERVQSEIIPFSQKFEEKMLGAKAKMESLDAKLQLLDMKMQLYVLLDSIRLGGSRKAYEQLVSLSKSSSDVKSLAGNYLKVIEFEFETLRETPSFVVSGRTYKWRGKKYKLDEIPVEQIYNIIGYVTTSMEARKDLLQHLRERDRNEVLTMALDVLNNSDALYSCLAASLLISRLTKKEGDITDFSYWAKMCQRELKEESP